MNTKHTPGPWTPYNARNGRIFKGWAINSKEGQIASIRESASPEVELANASLIAAAPELLEALQACVTEDGAACFRDSEYMKRRIFSISGIARAAIARAAGE